MIISMSRWQTFNRNRARAYQDYLDQREVADEAVRQTKFFEAGQAFKQAGTALITYQYWLDRVAELERSRSAVPA